MSDIFNFESATEMARLILQDRILAKELGTTVFSPPLSHNIRRILDIGCGPGGWVIDMARQNPRRKVIGIDRSKAMVVYASGQAKMHRLKKCQFLQMDALKPFAFSELFDLVQIRAMSTVIPKVMWPMLMEECYQSMQLGGILTLIECEGILTNSTSLETYSRFCAQLLSRRGYGFSSNGVTLAMTLPILKQLLHQPGYQDIRSRSYLLDFSAGTVLHDAQRQSLESFFTSLRPVLIQAQIATEPLIEKTYMELRGDLSQSSFQGMLLYHAVWGEKGQR